MAKINIKSEKLTPFGGIFHVRNMFSRRKIGRKIGTVLLMYWLFSVETESKSSQQ